MDCNFVFSHQWYGRGSKDWDYYKCTVCGETVMVSEDEEPKVCHHPDVVKEREKIMVEDQEKAMLRRLLDKYGSE